MPLIFHAKRVNVYAAVESTPGTAIADATLFAAGNLLVQAHDVSMETKPSIVDRKPEGASLQSIPSVHGQVPATAKLSHRLFTSGTAGTAPAFGPLWKACFLSETVVSVTSVTYASNPNSAVSLTIGFEVLSEDGTEALRYVMSGARGNLSIKADKVQAPLFVTYNFDGAFQLSGGATTTPVSAITYPAETANAVRFGEFQGTPTGLFAEECDSLEIDRGVKTEMATSVINANGLLYAMLGDDAPTLKVGYRTRNKAALDTLNRYAVGTTFANSLQLGSTTGKRVAFSTSSSSQFKALSSKAFGVAYGYEATVDCHRDETGTASNALSIAFT